MGIESRGNPLNKLVNENPGKISDLLFERMRSLIITGELPPGYVFPIETQLCEQLNVSRSTLREVYKALSAAGYITRNKTGTCVNDRRSIIRATPLNISIEFSDINDILEFRRMLETESAYNAAMNATDEDIERIRDILDMKPYQDRNLQMLVSNDIKFHQLIAEGTHNKLIIQTMLHMQEAIEHESKFAFSKSLEIESQAKFGDLHWEIFEAIQNHEPEAAGRAMQHHMEMVVLMLQNMPADSTMQDGTP